MVLVQLALQIVLLMLACVTFGFSTPGVRCRSGQLRLLASPGARQTSSALNANAIVFIQALPAKREVDVRAISNFGANSKSSERWARIVVAISLGRWVRAVLLRRPGPHLRARPKHASA